MKNKFTDDRREVNFGYKCRHLDAMASIFYLRGECSAASKFTDGAYRISANRNGDGDSVLNCPSIRLIYNDINGAIRDKRVDFLLASCVVHNPKFQSNVGKIATMSQVQDLKSIYGQFKKDIDTHITKLNKCYEYADSCDSFQIIKRLKSLFEKDNEVFNETSYSLYFNQRRAVLESALGEIDQVEQNFNARFDAMRDIAGLYKGTLLSIINTSKNNETLLNNFYFKEFCKAFIRPIQDVTKLLHHLRYDGEIDIKLITSNGISAKEMHAELDIMLCPGLPKAVTLFCGYTESTNNANVEESKEYTTATDSANPEMSNNKYIGVSKLCCTDCAEYLDMYSIKYRGTHGHPKHSKADHRTERSLSCDSMEENIIIFDNLPAREGSLHGVKNALNIWNDNWIYNNINQEEKVDSDTTPIDIIH
jgi:hypothetical protein